MLRVQPWVVSLFSMTLVSCFYLGFIHMETISGEPAQVLVRLDLSATRRRRLGCPKTHIFETGSQSAKIWTRRFHVSVVTVETAWILNWWRYSTTFALTRMRRAPPTSHMIPAGANARTHPRPRSHQKSSFGYKKNWILICPQIGQFLTNFKNLKFHIFIEIYIFFSFLWCVDIVSISNATTVRSSVGF